MDEDEDIESDEPLEKQPKKSPGDRIKAWQYKKGQSGNPNGRPVGSVSMKVFVRNKLLSMTDEEREDFLEGVDKRVIWEMAEDKPKQGVDVRATVTISDVLDELEDGHKIEGQELENQPPVQDPQ